MYAMPCHADPCTQSAYPSKSLQQPSQTPAIGQYRVGRVIHTYTHLRMIYNVRHGAAHSTSPITCHISPAIIPQSPSLYSWISKRKSVLSPIGIPDSYNLRFSSDMHRCRLLLVAKMTLSAVKNPPLHTTAEERMKAAAAKVALIFLHLRLRVWISAMTGAWKARPSRLRVSR